MSGVKFQILIASHVEVLSVVAFLPNSIGLLFNIKLGLNAINGYHLPFFVIDVIV